MSIIDDLYLSQDEEKAEDEMAKRRAAFLLKQQRKAEEARLRKQQQEVESEFKRDEARYTSSAAAQSAQMFSSHLRFSPEGARPKRIAFGRRRRKRGER